MVTEQLKTLEALQTAIRMEIDGKAFYLKASQISGSSLGKALFESLAKEEDLHRQKFEEIYQAVQTRNAWPRIAIPSGGTEHIRTLFVEGAQNIQFVASELEAIQTAMDMENKTYDFYKEQSRKAVYQTEKRYYESLAEQERVHHAILLDYQEYIQNPAQYFTMKERHSLDGG